MKSRLRRYLFPASVLLLYAIWALLLGSVFRRGETPIVNRFIGYCVSGLLLGLMPAVQAAMDGRFEFKIAPLSALRHLLSHLSFAQVRSMQQIP